MPGVPSKLRLAGSYAHSPPLAVHPARGRQKTYLPLTHRGGIGVIDAPTIKKVEEALRGFLDLWV
jgi:hypothetical protein